MDERIIQRFPWYNNLTTEHQRQFEEELYDLLRAMSATNWKEFLDHIDVFQNNYVELRELLEEWKATAEVDANPELRETLLTRSKAPDSEFEDFELHQQA